MQITRTYTWVCEREKTTAEIMTCVCTDTDAIYVCARDAHAHARECHAHTRTARIGLLSYNSYQVRHNEDARFSIH